MSRRVAIFGGSFNPPGSHHQQIAKALAAHFDEVIIVPCGPRPDKPSTSEAPAPYRAALADLAFGDLPSCRVDLFDLEGQSFTRSADLLDRYAREGQPFLVVGSDLIAGGAGGQSPIQLSWHRGAKLWDDASWAVVTRPGSDFDPADLPPRAELIACDVPGASADIRQQLADGTPAHELVPPRVACYIERYGLYRGIAPSRTAIATLPDSPPFVIADTKNPRAIAAARSLVSLSAPSPESASCIVVVGGDGMMLRAIREHWRRRLPFFGINAGHIGFLMNGPEQGSPSGPYPPREVSLHLLPLLFVRLTHADGRPTTSLAFNDAWVERASSQTAWLEVSLNGKVRIPHLASDGALLATPAGSTAYARSMGATPLLPDTPGWLLVGSNVFSPPGWRSALLSPEVTVTLRNRDPLKRPVHAYVDGVDHGLVSRMDVRLSRAATAELAFYPDRDVAEKIARIQFGSG